jgi:hypothetical protein
MSVQPYESQHGWRRCAAAGLEPVERYECGLSAGLREEGADGREVLQANGAARHLRGEDGVGAGEKFTA